MSWAKPMLRRAILGWLVCSLLVGSWAAPTATAQDGASKPRADAGTPLASGDEADRPLATADVSAHADPAAPGPLATSSFILGGNNTLTRLQGWPGPVEVVASVHHPRNLNRAFPLIIFLHGMHATCHDGQRPFGGWPCGPGRRPIDNFRGYDYLASRLASHGYIVASIGGNGINALSNVRSVAPDGGANGRALLIQHHLNIWSAINAGQGAGILQQFRGRVNLQNVGTMGHSRGGEGVARHFELSASGSPYGIKAVFPLAPTDFTRIVLNNVPLGTLLPYCDGDVTDLQGVKYYDDSRYNVQGDTGPKHTFLVLGANHNYYNTIWSPSARLPGSSDDAATNDQLRNDPFCGARGSGRLGEVAQRGTGLAYIIGFFRAYIGGRTDFLSFLTGEAPPPPSATTNQIHTSYHAPATNRVSLNRLTDRSNLTTNFMGGRVAQFRVAPFELCGGPPPQPRHCLRSQPLERQPHTARVGTNNSQLRTGWGARTATISNEVPAANGDLTGLHRLNFRAAINISDPRNPRGVAQDFNVVLVDAAGKRAAVPVSAHSRALFYPPGSVGPVPKSILNMVRVPLSAFRGVNLREIRSVQFQFARRNSGALLISDIVFDNPPR